MYDVIYIICHDHWYILFATASELSSISKLFSAKRISLPVKVKQDRQWDVKFSGEFLIKQNRCISQMYYTDDKSFQCCNVALALVFDGHSNPFLFISTFRIYFLILIINTLYSVKNASNEKYVRRLQ